MAKVEVGSLLVMPFVMVRQLLAGEERLPDLAAETSMAGGESMAGGSPTATPTWPGGSGAVGSW